MFSTCSYAIASIFLVPFHPALLVRCRRCLQFPLLETLNESLCWVRQDAAQFETCTHCLCLLKGILLLLLLLGVRMYISRVGWFKLLQFYIWKGISFEVVGFAPRSSLVICIIGGCGAGIIVCVCPLCLFSVREVFFLIWCFVVNNI